MPPSGSTAVPRSATTPPQLGVTPAFALYEVQLLLTLILVHRTRTGRAVPAGLHRRAAGGVPAWLRVVGAAGSPVRQQTQRAGQLPALRAQLVHGAWRAPRVGLGDHQSLSLQMSKPLRQDVGSDPVDILKQV